MKCCMMAAAANRRLQCLTGNNGGLGLYCTGVGEILEHCLFFNPSCKQLDQLAVRSEEEKRKENVFFKGNLYRVNSDAPQRFVVPDVDGRVGQDLAVAVPAAVGGSTATSWVVSADLAEDLAFAALLQVELQF